MDFILHESAALSKESCDGYIELFEMNPQIQVDGSVNVQGKPLIDSESKKCKEIYLHEYRFFAPIQTCLSQGILKYKEKYSSIDELERWNVDSNFKIQKYLPGEGFFRTHCENGSVQTSHRVLAWMIYLNDVYDEGHTVFPNQEKKFQPRVGDLLIWPAHFTHVHHGVTSESETKYILSGWFIFIPGAHPWEKDFKS